MAQVRLTATGIEVAVARLEQLDLSDATDLMTAVGQTMKLQTIERFTTETDPDGAKWRGLAASTVAQKGSSGILKDTGALMGSFDVEPGPRSVRVGTGVYYGAFHQHGGTRAGWPNGCPPKRAFMGINEENAQEIGQVVEAYIASKLG